MVLPDTYIVMSTSGYWGGGGSLEQANANCKGSKTAQRVAWRIYFPNAEAQRAQRALDAEFSGREGFIPGVLDDGRPYAGVSSDGAIHRASKSLSEKLGRVVRGRIVHSSA